MRKSLLLAGVAALTVGLGAASSSAYAMGCLTNQEALPFMSLSHDDMVPDAGFGYDKDAYDAALAKGNACSTTQQSQPVAATAPLGTKATHVYRHVTER